MDAHPCWTAAKKTAIDVLTGLGLAIVTSVAIPLAAVTASIGVIILGVLLVAIVLTLGVTLTATLAVLLAIGYPISSGRTFKHNWKLARVAATPCEMKSNPLAKVPISTSARN